MKTIGGKKPLSFAGIFVLVAAVEYLIFYHFAPDLFTSGLIEVTAKMLHWTVSIFEKGVVLSGSRLHFPDMDLIIIYECTGGFAMFIFSACVIAYPSTILSKIWGHVLGIIGVFVINMGRLLVLSLSALYARDLFDFIHKYLWQATFILLVLAMWVIWINIFVEKKKSHKSVKAKVEKKK
jgi:archaeosortase B (VPXXXP-CTERM-specific)